MCRLGSLCLVCLVCWANPPTPGSCQLSRRSAPRLKRTLRVTGVADAPNQTIDHQRPFLGIAPCQRHTCQESGRSRRDLPAALRARDPRTSPARLCNSRSAWRRWSHAHASCLSSSSTMRRRPKVPPTGEGGKHPAPSHLSVPGQALTSPCSDPAVSSHCTRPHHTPKGLKKRKHTLLTQPVRGVGA